MLEGKELEGKIGEYGAYGVDVKPDGHIEADAHAAIEKSFGGFITVKGAGQASVNFDIVGGLDKLVEGTDSAILKGLIGAIGKALGR